MVTFMTRLISNRSSRTNNDYGIVNPLLWYVVNILCYQSDSKLEKRRMSGSRCLPFAKYTSNIMASTSYSASNHSVFTKCRISGAVLRVPSGNQNLPREYVFKNNVLGYAFTFPQGVQDKLDLNNIFSYSLTAFS